MALILPILSFLSFWLGVTSKRSQSWREGFLIAAIWWGMIVVAMTEGLSLFHALTPIGLTLAWAMILCAVLGLTWWHIALFEQRFPPVSRNWQSFSLAERALIGAVLLIVLVTLLVGVLKPPSTFDAMTYHLSRIMHWAQNQSVDHYSTHIIRQLYQNPWAEFSIANLLLLSGGDRVAHLVQWFSMVGSLIGVSLIAESLTGKLSSALSAAVVAATLPAGILQSTSTQNDYVETLWLVCCAFLMLRTSQTLPTMWQAIGIGSSAALAILTKGTSFIYLSPFLLWWSLNGLRKWPRKLLIRSCIVIAVLIGIVNAGHWSRNYAVFGSILGPTEDDGADHTITTYRNEVWGISPLASNLLRNVALHAGTSHPVVERALERSINVLHRWMGIDPSDPRTTWPGRTFAIPKLAFDEDHAGNPAHLLLILWAFGSILGGAASHQSRRPIVPYTLVVLSTFVLFCAVFKWQPWHSRLHLPFFVLAAPSVAWVFSRLSHRRLVYGIEGLLAIAALIWLANGHRDFYNARQLPRGLQYFASQPAKGSDYYSLAQLIPAISCTQIGFYASGDSWE
ncbi:MAG: hypothetical protein DDG58_05140, partial [Ardenticatenia bacterium]